MREPEREKLLAMSRKLAGLFCNAVAILADLLIEVRFKLDPKVL